MGAEPANPTYDPAYTVTARVLHWLVAALVLFQIPAGIIIANECGGPVQERLYDLHKSVGAVLRPLVLARVIYRATQPPPQSAAHTTPWTLYALLIVQPLVGLIATSAYPAPIPIFGLFDLPL